MINSITSIRQSHHIGFELPPQAIPTKDKDENWEKACMDTLENIGIRQITQNWQKYKDTFSILNGNFRYADVTRSSLFLKEVDFWREQADTKKELDNYGFIEPLVNQMIGDFLKTPNPITIHTTDSHSKNDYVTEKSKRLWEAVQQQLENTLKLRMVEAGIDPDLEEFESEEQQQQYIQQVQSIRQQFTPEEIEKEMNQDWKPIYVEWVEDILKEDYNRFVISEIDRKNYFEYLATGKCFRHDRVRYDSYAPEFWSIKDTFYDDSAERTEQGEYVGQIKLLSGNDIVARLGHLMSEDNKQRVLKSKFHRKENIKSFNNSIGNTGNVERIARGEASQLKHTPHPAFTAYENSKFIQDATGIDLGMPELFPTNVGSYYLSLWGNESDRTDLIRVTEGYWVGYQRIGRLVLKNEETQETYAQLVTDDILPSLLRAHGIKQIKDKSLVEFEEDLEPNTICWDYQKVVYQGIKIAKENTDLEDDLYLQIRQLPYQLKGESEDYDTILPVVGINETTSFVSRLENEQRDYNIHMNMAKEMNAKNLGILYAFDMSFLPSFLKDNGAEESIVKIMDIIRELGILPLDGSAGNTTSNFNQFTAVNADMTGAILGQLQAAQTVKRMAFEKLGFSPERLGTPTQKTATQAQMAQQASFSQTEKWLDSFINFQKRAMEMHVNIAQYVKREGIDTTVMYADGYKKRVFTQLNDPFLTIRKFRIYFQNDSKSRLDLETIKQVYFNDNTIMKDLESMAKVAEASSVSKVLEAGRIQRQITQLEQQKQNEARLKEIELQAAIDEEKENKEREWKSRENDLDRRAQIYREQLRALGFTKDTDVNDNNVVDVIKQAELALKEMAQTTEFRFKELDREDKRVENERKYLAEDRKLSIEQQRVDAMKYKADKELEKARENKTQYELRAQNKLPKDGKK